MDRRNFLRVTGAALASGSLSKVIAAGDKEIHGGWLDLPKARAQFIARTRRPYASQHTQHLVGDSDGKVVRLWKLWERAAGEEFQPHYQEIGDCVSQAYGLGSETVSGVQVFTKGDEFSGKISTEVTYGLSRVEVGGGTLTSDGSVGAWASESLEDYGVVKRGKYGDIDLTKYDPELARKWGKARSQGIPLNLEKKAKEHSFQRCVLIDGGWKQACDIMASGYPIAICSSVGFNNRTDAEGFLRADRKWYHAMLLWGFDRKSRRQGGCIANSWGLDWLHGQKHKYDTPGGCFWADANVIERMLSQGDSYALTDFRGFRRQNLDYLLW